MRIFIIILLLTVLSIARSDDTADKAEAAKKSANDADDAAKKATDADKEANKGGPATAEKASDGASDAAKAAKDKAVASEEAAKDAADSAKKVSKTETKEAGKAAESANEAATAAKKADAAAKDASKEADEKKCEVRKPHAVPALKFKHLPPGAPGPSEKELEAERQYMKKHHKAVHAAILVMKDLKAKYRAAKNVIKPEEKPHKRYLKTGVYFKRANGDVCNLFHGFKHVHIERVMCRPEDDAKCVGVTDEGKKMYTPTAFNTYVIYADCKNKKTEINPEPIHIKVATKCSCQVLKCRK